MTLSGVLLAAASIAAAPAASDNPARTAQEVVVSPQEANRKLLDEWGFSEAVIDHDRVYLSGVVAVLREGETDQSAAFDRAFRTVADVLERSGASWDSVIEMTTFHTDLPSQLKDFVTVKQRYVRSPYPAWTAIDIDRLVPDRGLVEIKVVARRAATSKSR